MPLLTISHLRLRGLPRRLLRAPTPYVELHLQPGAEPAFTTPAQERTTTPTWPHVVFTHEAPTCCTPPPLGFVVRDSQSPHPPLGRLALAPDAALLEGWFPLRRDGADTTAAPPAELYVRIVTRELCELRPRQCAFARTRAALTHTPVDAPGELRRASRRPGCLFRCGELVISVLARGVPVSVKEPFLIAETAGQSLRAFETEPSRAAWEALCDRQAAHPAPPPEAGAAMEDVDEAEEEASAPGGPATGNVTALKSPSGSSKRAKAGNVAKKKSGKLAKTVLKKAPVPSNLELLLERARIYTKGGAAAPPPDVAEDVRDEMSLDDGEEECSGGEDSDNGGEPDVLDSGVEADVEVSDVENSGVLADYDVGMAGQAAFSSDMQSGSQPAASSSDIQSGAQAAAAFPPKKKENRRQIEFGSFSFAVLQGTPPSKLKFQMQDMRSSLPAPLGNLTELKLTLPDLNEFNCVCPASCKTHVFELHLADPGAPGAKISFDVRVTYKHWEPMATCMNVTPRFHEIFSESDAFASTFNDRFPRAKDLTYLFVGGLFTQHYPTYFQNNIRYLQEKLFLPRVQTVPIHTEGSIARNAKVIRDSILKTCRGAKSVVLVGHSKGGLDAVSVLEMFPEAVPFIHGIITFQAPFGGTYLIDFVSRSKLAVSAITSVIETIWKGDQDAFHDLGYSARLQSLGLATLERQSSKEEESFVDELSPTPSNNPEQTPGQVDEERLQQMRIFSKVPCVSFASRASFDLLGIRSAANAAGIASMAPAAQKIVQHTGFACDGLVTPGDARVPFSDLVHLDDMMHTEPALYVQGSKYPPGRLTACGLVLLFEKAARPGGV